MLPGAHDLLCPRTMLHSLLHPVLLQEKEKLLRLVEKTVQAQAQILLLRDLVLLCSGTQLLLPGSQRLLRPG